MSSLKQPSFLPQEAAAGAGPDEEMYRRLVEMLPDGVAVLERERFVYANEALAALIGVPRDDLAGTMLLERVHPSSRAAVTEALASAGGHGSTLHETLFARPDGTPVHGEIVLRRFACRKRPSLLLVVRDLTSQRAAAAALHDAEQRSRQSQKLEAVGRLAGGVAHDFNNLLTVITCCADMALSRAADDGPLKEDLMEVRSAAKRAADLTRQLLAFSRRQMLRPQLLDLDEIVVENARMLRRIVGEHIRIELRPATSPVWVEADRVQLGQVLLNLVVNSRDAMPQGGRVVIGTGIVDAARSPTAPATGTRARYATLCVQDEGLGMDEDTRVRAFEPFFTTKDTGQGTGLGLSTVYGIVSQSGGMIDVESAPGMGTTVSVYLPLRSPDEPV